MKTLKILTSAVVIVALTTAVHAQRGMGRGGNYNPATETTVSGTVDEVKAVPAPGRGPGGLHLILSAPSGTIPVHVGPAAFVASKNVSFVKGDALTIVGSRMTMGSEEVLIAREIRKGEQVLTLRDSKGFPLWSGRGRMP